MFSGLIHGRNDIRGDRIQGCQLLTKKIYSQQSYVLIFQYNDKITRVTINNDNDNDEKEELCNSDEMTRLVMQRGSNNKVYYAKTKGYSGILMEVEHHKSQVHEIVETEVFRLPGEKILAFQMDLEEIVDSGDENSAQAVFLMTDRQRIYYIKHDEGMNF